MHSKRCQNKWLWPILKYYHNLTNLKIGLQIIETFTAENLYAGVILCVYEP